MEYDEADADPTTRREIEARKDTAKLEKHLATAIRERDEAQKRLERQTDWYQQRFNRLRRWVEEEVRPLSGEVATRYYAICANGSPAPHESADWRDTMHSLRLELDQTREELDQTREELDQTREELDQTREELDQTREELAANRYVHGWLAVHECDDVALYADASDGLRFGVFMCGNMAPAGFDKDWYGSIAELARALGRVTGG